jgi:prophage antirepressor-like protein
MSALIPFDYSGRQVRTVQVDGEPWFVAADVCSILALGNVTQALSRVAADDLSSNEVIDSMGRTQVVRTVNESGLYDLILDSRKPEARAFRRWVTSEVLPAIRKTGRYETDVPRSLPEALRAFAAEVEAHEQTRAELVVVKPQAEAWATLADTGADYSVRDASYILNRDPSINTGQRRLFATLREWRLIGPGNKPYANHAKHVTLRPQTREDRFTGERVPADPQVRVTVDGLAYLHKRMGGTAPLDASSLDGAA